MTTSLFENNFTVALLTSDLQNAELIHQKPKPDAVKPLANEIMLQTILDILNRFSKQTDILNFLEFIKDYLRKKFFGPHLQQQFSKFTWSLLFALDTNEKNREVAFFLNLIPVSKAHHLAKIYLRFRRVIVDYLCGDSNALVSVDTLDLTVDQWVTAINRIFSDQKPTEVVNQITNIINRNKELTNQKHALNASVLIELCMIQNENPKRTKRSPYPKNAYKTSSDIKPTFYKWGSPFIEDKGDKVYDSDKRPTNRPMSVSPSPNRKSIAPKTATKTWAYDVNDRIELQKLRKRIKDLEAENNKLRREYNQGKKGSDQLQDNLKKFSESFKFISDMYLEMIAYSYAFENSTKLLAADLKVKNMELYLKYFGSREDQRKELTPYYFLQLKETREKLRKIGLFKPDEKFGDFLETIGSKTFQDKVDMKRYDSPYYFLGRKKKEEEGESPINSTRQASPARSEGTAPSGNIGSAPMMQQDNVDTQDRRASQMAQEIYGNILRGMGKDADEDEESDNTSDDLGTKSKY